MYFLLVSVRCLQRELDILIEKKNGLDVNHASKLYIYIYILIRPLERLGRYYIILCVN